MGGDSGLGVSFEEASGAGFVLGSNPVVGVDLGPDVADHAEELGQDALSVFLLGALHALHLAPGGLLHLRGQVSLGAHGLEGEEGAEEGKEETEKEGPGMWRKDPGARPSPNRPSHGNSQTLGQPSPPRPGVPRRLYNPHPHRPRPRHSAPPTSSCSTDWPFPHNCSSPSDAQAPKCHKA